MAPDPTQETLLERVRRLAREAIDEGNPTGWFERVYLAAQGDVAEIPWQDGSIHILFEEWLQRSPVEGAGRRALVIGCGLGDNAEELARRGFRVTAFDISPTAIEWCKRRFPRTKVEYRVADLLAPPEEWSQGFDLVLECLTLQALPREVRHRAFAPMAGFAAPGGRLLVINRGREPSEPDEGPPWSVTRADMDRFRALGLTESLFEDLRDAGDPPARRFRALYTRG